MMKGLKNLLLSILIAVLILSWAPTVHGDSCVHDYERIEEPGDCTNPGMTYDQCILCGHTTNFENTPALGHSFGGWIVDTKATCTRSGVEVRTCSRCGYQEEQQIAATGHAYDTQVVAATCTDEGYTVHTCRNCQDSYKDNYTEAGEHGYVGQVFAPTCTEGGYTIYICAGCGDSYKADETEAAGHQYDDGVLTKEPTTTAMGRMTYTCLVCGDSYTVTTPKLTDPFEDVKPSDWYYDAVLWAVDRGITNGVDETHFDPDRICNRAQIVTFLWRFSGTPEPASGDCGFVDVSSDGWYYKAVLWAVEAGIVNGVDDTHFDPNGTATRAQVVTMLYRMFGEPPVEGVEIFSDVPSTAYYADAVAWAYWNDITAGTGGGLFTPNASCTRAQVVCFLYRARNLNG